LMWVKVNRMLRRYDGIRHGDAGALFMTCLPVSGNGNLARDASPASRAFFFGQRRQEAAALAAEYVHIAARSYADFVLGSAKPFVPFRRPRR